MSTSSTAALSSVLSALNNGSTGIDVTSAVASIIAAERTPETAWQAQQTTLNNQAAALQQLESEANAVTEALQTLGDAGGDLSAISATSSNTSVLNATAAAGTAAGTHSVTVSQLATTGSWYSAEEPTSSTTLANGSISISSGGVDHSFTIGSGVNTLDQLATAINAGSIGVTANVVNDGTGSRLALVAQSSGAAADFSVSSSSTLTFTQSQPPGLDASLKVDGVPVTSASNTITGVVPGLTLTLTGTSTTPVTVGLAPDSSTITSDVSTFVNAYNALIKDLNGQFTYSGSTSSEGTLGSDSVVRSLQSDVLNASNLSGGSGTIPSLSALGVTTNQDGTLSLNSSTLNQALTSNFQGVVDFFQGSGSETGYASSFIATLNQYTDPSQGSFEVDLKSEQSEYADLTNQISTFELYIASQQTTLTAEYNNANIALQQLPEQIKQVQALLGENSSGSNS